MELILLGTGTPHPNPERRGASMVLLVENEAVLIDCGSGAATQLVRAGVPLKGVNPLFFTHHHSDHNIDYGHFFISRWLTGAESPLEVYGPARTRRITEALLTLHAYDLEIRSSTAGRSYPKIEAHEIAGGETIRRGGWTVRTAEVEHPPVEPCLAYRFEAHGRSVVISGDTRPCAGLIDLARGADVLVHDLVQPDLVPRDLAKGEEQRRRFLRVLTSYLTTPDQVGKTASRAGVRTLVLTHLQPKTVEKDLREIVARDFRGDILVGRDLLRIPIN